MNPYADTTPTGPIRGLLPVTTVAMPIIKPLPPNLAWAMAELRPHLELMASRFRGLMAELDRVGAALADLQRQLDIEAERAEGLGL